MWCLWLPCCSLSLYCRFSFSIGFLDSGRVYGSRIICVVFPLSFGGIRSRPYCAATHRSHRYVSSKNCNASYRDKFVCHVYRDNWNPNTVGLIQSSLFWGYLLTWIVGGV